MKSRIGILAVVGLLALVGVWWHGRPQPMGGAGKLVGPGAKPASAPAVAVVTATNASGPAAAKAAMVSTNRFAYRLSNTTNTLRQLQAKPHAILLANALIDTDRAVDLKIPSALRSAGDPGAYIVEARGPIGAAFRAALARAGAAVVSYIPNHAYLVDMAPAGAGQLAADPSVQVVLPYEPYYKLQSSLLGLAVNGAPLPPGTALTLGLFGADPTAVEAIRNLGIPILKTDQSPFGPMLTVLAPEDWTTLAQLKGVQYVEVSRRRQAANDMARVSLGVSADTLVPADYLNLYGSNVLVAVNDSGVDSLHPDFTTGGAAGGTAGGAPVRVEGLTPLDLVDTNGHGTHVAGIIAGNGAASWGGPYIDVGDFAEGSVSDADYRGKAPLAWLFSVNDANYTDYQLQTNAALAGALISNNSWDYGNGDAEYDLAAASYDFATRDAVPGQTGSQPVLFVFAAGNEGDGTNDGTGGASDTILSPGTAKNVLTVGALEQPRNITNLVTTIIPASGTNGPTTNTVAYWQTATDSSDQVAGYSSRGNVGVGTEGNDGRFKPDVVAPGTFVVSTSSQFNQEWATNAYYNPTNDDETAYTDQVADTNALDYYNVQVPANAVGVRIRVYANDASPNPLPKLVLYCQQSGYPDLSDPSAIDLITSNNVVDIPPGGGKCTIPSLRGNGFDFAVGVPTNESVNYDLTVEVLSTNNVGNLYSVLQGMNNSLGGYYRYESGTSLAAAGISGLLALIQDYFTNQFQPALIPSPALLKALVINGARTGADYELAFTNAVNLEGWGEADIQNSVPTGGLFDKTDGTTQGSTFFVEQNAQAALATGDSHTYFVTVNTNQEAENLYLQATLVWTDPPGDPAAAIKLVNNLDLVVTNLDSGDVNYRAVYVGNDIEPELGYNLPAATNQPANYDTINNVENVILPPALGGRYSVTVVGRGVNVNAVSAQSNNIVQDYALVIAVGEGEVTNAFSVTDGGVVSNATGDQDVTGVLSTNAPLTDQLVGASSPLLGTNQLGLGTAAGWGAGGVLTIGQTNQWHFYVVTNNGAGSDYTNAGFFTYGVSTLSLPRMGVYEDTLDNATTPEANLNLFVSEDGNLTNLSPVVLSNCLAGANNCRAGLANQGTQFAFYTNSKPGTVYYVGVQSADQMGGEYSFMPIFTDVPFSGLDANGNQIVNGLLLPMPTPLGNNTHPGLTNVFALAVLPMVIEKVTVTNLIQHQNFGDLVGTLSFHNQRVVLNSHDALGNTILFTKPIVYDSSINAPLGTRTNDGPGNLLDFRGFPAVGPWILSELNDTAGTDTGQITRLTLVIQPHRKLTGPGIDVVVPPGGWFYDWVDVPPGYTNLTLYGTNVSAGLPNGTQPIQMYELAGNDPTQGDYDQEATLTNGTPPGNDISVGPPLPMGRYYVGLYNPDATTSQTVFLQATLGIGTSAADIYTYLSGSSQVLEDDGVTPAPAPTGGRTVNAADLGSTIAVPAGATNEVSTVNVGMVVKSPRISDYAFTLVSPTGTRVLLMENRGGTDTNGAGNVIVYTNELDSTANGTGVPNTNYLTVYPNPAGVSVPLTWNFYTVADQMTVYTTTNAADFQTNSVYCLYNTGFATNAAYGSGAEQTTPVTTNLLVPAGVTAIAIVMNQFGNPFATNGDAWTYTAGSASTNYDYLVFTDDTNLADLPIKFAPTPFTLSSEITNSVPLNLDRTAATNYVAGQGMTDAVGNTWTVATNRVSVVTDPWTALGNGTGLSNYLALGNGSISTTIPTIPGRLYTMTFWYRGPGMAGWWRGEGNANDSSDPENNGHNGQLIGRFNFPAGEVGQAFGFEDAGDTYEFAGTNTYVQVPASTGLNVGTGGGFTVEGWINPTNVTRPEPLVEWLAQVPTNSATADTNLAIIQGPVWDRATGHYYYLLAATNWSTSEAWAQELGGDLVTLETANEDQWVYDTFTAYGTLNRDLWTGLNDQASAGAFVWVSGSTSQAFTNWAPGEPAAATASDNFMAILGPTNAYPGLWTLLGNNGEMGGNPPTNPIYGVVEVAGIPTNGVQFWVSGTNWTGATNVLAGCLAANIVDTNFVSHWIWSAPGLVTNNVYQHVALTFDTNSGLAALYLNGTNVATSNLFAGGVSFVPKTDGDLLLGHDMTSYTNNFFGGEMDEMSVYSRALSLAEISAIYGVSASTSNRLVGKFDASVAPAVGLAEAWVQFGASSNLLYGVNDTWEVESYTFTATSNSLPVSITGVEPGILLDSFAVNEAPETNIYYFPEEPLSALAGESAAGNWTLQVWDSRAGAYVTNVPQLVNWELTFVLVSNALISATLAPETPLLSTVEPGATVYYAVPVPTWAQAATNVLVSSTLPVDLTYYSGANAANSPGTATVPTATLLTGVQSGEGTPTLARVPGTGELALPAGTYYLGVHNGGTHAASVTLEADFDIQGLANGVPFTSFMTKEYSAERYFAFDVSTNAYEATFQLLQLSGTADLVLSKGGPLPDLSSASYGSFNNDLADQNLYVLTNSSPVALSAGRWYLGVFNRDGSRLQYSVLAKELDVTNLALPTSVMPAIINLANGVPLAWTAGPGAALTNFFHFQATNPVVEGKVVPLHGLRFEVYDLTGNGDLTVQTNGLPLAPVFYQSSQNAGTSPELVLVYTNSGTTNLAGDWYLGVPNREVTNINFNIVATIITNAYFPAFPGAEGAGGGAIGGGHAGGSGTVYHVTSLADSGPGTLRDAVNAPDRTVVFDVAGNIGLVSPLVITNSDLTIAGQTSPGGITVVDNMTTVSTAHDVIIRNVRFRPGDSAGSDSLQFLSLSNAIADHISASWSANNLVSVLGSSNITVQWSIMADGLSLTNECVCYTNRAIGSLLRFGSGTLSFHHNLYANDYSGSPRLGDNLTLDFVNNVIFNWGPLSGWSGGSEDLDFSAAGCTNQLNYVCNYLIAGLNTADNSANYAMTNIAFFGGTTNGNAATWIFQTNNFIDSNTNGVLNGSDTGWGMFTNDYTRFARAFPTPPVSVDEAFIAYERVLDFAGVDLEHRDSMDVGIVNEVRTKSPVQLTNTLAPQPAGLVSWWRAEGNANDVEGQNNGLLQNGLTFGVGKVGCAFDYHTVNADVLVPASDSLNVGAGNGFTLEAWINCSNPGVLNPIFEWNLADGVTEWGVHLYVGAGGPNSLYANVVDSGGVWHNFWSAPVIFTNVFQHVALTYDKVSGMATIYCNGTNVVQQNVGSFKPQTTYPLYLGRRPGPDAYLTFAGLIDEAKIFNRALSQAEIQSIYNAENSPAQVVSPLPYLDTDQDGIPDFWEYTFTPTLVFVPSNNHDRDGDGYTDLEEYNNWLAGPHALTVTNTSVGVDLYRLCGESGRLAFYVTNGVQGTVYLTNVLGTVTNTSPGWSNTVAVFTPTNTPGSGTNYSGYASFDFLVTNLDTAAYIGPVTVSVIVSAVPIVINSNMPPVITPLTSGQSSDPTNYGGSDFYSITVPTNAYGALFEIQNPTGPMALVVSDGLPLPSLSSYAYMTNLPAAPANLEITVFTNSSPVALTPGTWYMAAVNESGSNVVYEAKITLFGVATPPVFYYPTNGYLTNILETVPFSLSCVATDYDTPVLPLSYALVSGPTNVEVSSAGVLNWTPTEAQGPSTNLVALSVGNGAYSVTNTFTIVVEESNLPPVLPHIPNQLVLWPGHLVVTNTATDPDIPTNPLTYYLTSTVGGVGNVPVISSNGVISWTPDGTQVGTNYLLTTIVRDTNPWAVNAKSLSDTNSFYVTVLSAIPPHGGPQTNTVPPGSLNWYAVPVPQQADMATNTLLYATGPVNLWYSTNLPPSTNQVGDAELLTSSTGGSRVISPTSMPPLVPGSTYFLGVQNLGAVPVTDAISVTFHYGYPKVSDFTIVQTNLAGTNGYLLSWVAPTNEQFHVQWVRVLQTNTWANFNGVVSYQQLVAATNGQFEYYDDGSQTAGFDRTRYYRLEWLESPTNTAPYFRASPAAVYYVSPGVEFMYTNAAADWDIPPQTLSYEITNSLTDTNVAVIEGEGIITWTPTWGQLGETDVITTTVTDNGVPAASVSDSFTVIVSTNTVVVAPTIGKIIVGSGGVSFAWTAPASDQFELRWTTNLLVPNWQILPGTITSATTNYSYVDTNTPLSAMKFYQLILLP